MKGTPLGIKDYSWEIRYRSACDDLLNDFYIPALSRSILYQRSAGYFSTASLMVAARGIAHLIKNGGKMQLVVSPYFSEEDILAIEKGYKKKGEVIREALERQFSIPEEDFIKRRLEAVSWMIANDLLDIKIAYTVRNRKVKRGLYHEKMGIFTDRDDDYLTFSGSNNESEDAYIYNFESFDVQCSWKSGLSEQLARMKKQEFEDLWQCRTDNLEIVTMPEAIKERLLELRPNTKPERDPEEMIQGEPHESKNKRTIGIPNHIELRKHQEEAIKQWFGNQGRGVIEHATGSGKTITALSASVRLFEKFGRLAVVVICPQKHLVDQWNTEAKKFGFVPLIGYEDSSKWFSNLNSNVVNFNLRVKKVFMFITTNSSFRMPKTLKVIEKIIDDFLVIGDEVHNLGAPYLRTCLIENTKYRIGLSATPKRWHDEEGSTIIFNYFGKPLQPPYGIKEAIRDGYLCKYLYYPHLVELTPEEGEEYHELSEKISKCGHYDRVQEEFRDNDPLSILLFKRARLLGTATNKLKVLKKVASSCKDTYFNLFYCGDGKVEDEKQIDKVCRLLGQDLGMRVARFTHQEDTATRRSILEQLKRKDLQGLVAIRCLDEGLDVPVVKRAFILASSTNPRQFIQRRGRILRKPRGDDSKVAEVHDFIVTPPDIERAKQTTATVFNIERKLIRKELLRFAEFAETAENGPQAHEEVLKIKRLYNLLDV